MIKMTTTMLMAFQAEEKKGAARKRTKMRKNERYSTKFMHHEICTHFYVNTKFHLKIAFFSSTRVQCAEDNEFLVLSYLERRPKKESRQHGKMRWFSLSFNSKIRPTFHVRCVFWCFYGMSQGWQICVKYKRRCHKNDYGNDVTGREKRQEKWWRRNNQPAIDGLHGEKLKRKMCWQHLGDLCTG